MLVVLIGNKLLAPMIGLARNPSSQQSMITIRMMYEQIFKPFLLKLKHFYELQLCKKIIFL